MAFLGVGSAAPVAEMAEFVERTGTGAFPQIADEGGDIWAAFGATVRSSFLFVDGETGAVTRTGYGQMDEDRLRRLVADLAAN